MTPLSVTLTMIFSRLLVAVYLLLLFDLLTVDSYRSQLNYTIQDNVMAGSTVGQVGYDSELIDSHVRFSLMTVHHQTYSRLFDMDATSGRLYAASNIDRDIICTGRAQCVIELTVQARGGGRLVTVTFVKVIVEVKDDNDNWPTFDRPEVQVDVTEAASVGARVAMLPRARDIDSPSNGVRQYLIESESHRGVFTVVTSAADVYLVLQAPLDRETLDRYSFQLVAVDGGSPPLSGTTSIQVLVTDVDDNSPMFERSVYHAVVSEDARTGSRIATVRAVDADLGANGRVVYSLVQQTDQLPFHINSTSGVISTSGQLDYESRDEYTLTVRAASRSGIETGSTALAAHAQVLVRVTDVNDNAPMVVIATNHHDDCNNCSHVTESLPPETYVAHVTVVDTDPVDGRTECHLNSDNFRLEKSFESLYQVLTAVVLDREVRSSYELVITCSDAVDTNMTSHSSTASLYVYVDDINDHAPVFRSRDYLAQVAENQPAGTTVAVVEAIDSDKGRNAEVRYHLLSTSGADFRLDMTSGSLTTNRKFDREKQETVNATVVAVDLGNPSMSSTAHVSVSILDVDDEVAEFLHSDYEFRVEEERSTGELVGQVTAIDRDLPPYNSVIYSLLFHDQPDVFSIDASDGTIVTCRSLDREITNYFRFVARACSAANTCSTTHVTVHVTDINDHAPVFLFPVAADNNVSVTNRFRRGDVITRLVAVDADVGDNGRVEYQLVDVDHVVDFYFRLDYVTGDILARQDSSAVTGSYTLVVAAVDAGTPSRRVQTALTIVVNISTSGKPLQSQPNASSDDNLAVVVVIVGTSLPVAILLLAAILVLLRNRARVERTAAVTSHGVYGSKLSSEGAATNQEYATLSRARTSTRLAAAVTVQPRYDNHSQVNSCRRQSLVRSQPPVAPPGESEDTTDSGRGSSVDVSGRRVGLSSTRKGPAVQTTTLPPCQHLPQNVPLRLRPSTTSSPLRHALCSSACPTHLSGTRSMPTERKHYDQLTTSVNH